MNIEEMFESLRDGEVTDEARAYFKSIKDIGGLIGLVSGCELGTILSILGVKMSMAAEAEQKKNDHDFFYFASTPIIGTPFAEALEEVMLKCITSSVSVKEFRDLLIQIAEHFFSFYSYVYQATE